MGAFGTISSPQDPHPFYAIQAEVDDSEQQVRERIELIEHLTALTTGEKKSLSMHARRKGCGRTTVVREDWERSDGCSTKVRR